jgi:ABC-type uncharacterized transport system substrate-binding protein
MRYFLCALLALVSLFVNAGEPKHVLIVMSQHSAPYEEVAQALTTALTAETPGIEIRRVERSNFASLSGNSDIIVAVGGEAAELAAAGAADVPILNLFIPRRLHEQFARQRQRKDAMDYSAVFLDQPPARQFALIRLAFPGRNSIGLLAGPASAPAIPELQSASTKRDLRLNVAHAQSMEELPKALRELTVDADVLMLLPDPAILNASTAKDILIFAYRAGTPVVGFSPNYVAAGAMLGLYSTPQQMALQGASAILQWLRGNNLPPAQYPRDFEVGINTSVARSLNFSLEPAASLTDKLRRNSP